MGVMRMDLADTGSPEGLVSLILKHEPELRVPVPIEELALQLEIEGVSEVIPNASTEVSTGTETSSTTEASSENVEQTSTEASTVTEKPVTASPVRIRISGSIEKTIEVQTGTTLEKALKENNIEHASMSFKAPSGTVGLSRKLTTDLDLTAITKTRMG